MLVGKEISKLDPDFRVDIFLVNGDYILNWTLKIGKRKKIRTFRNNTLEEAQRSARRIIAEHETAL